MKTPHSAPLPKALLPEMIRAAKTSGRILRKYFGQTRLLKVREKAGAGLVTEADLASEKAALKILKKLRPDFGVLAEESAPTSSPENSRPEGLWIIDPLDGTTNFVHGFPMFCVSIAAQWKGRIIAGVIYHPILDDVFAASLGGGAFLNDRPIQVSSTREIKSALLTTGFSYAASDAVKGAQQKLHLEMLAFERLSSVARAVRRPGSAALDLAYTACGVFDGFWERGLSPWDIAAGSLLVQEAGGKVSDFSGQKLNIQGVEILASNKNLHRKLLNTIAPEHCLI